VARPALPGRHTSITSKGPSQLGESLWSPSRFSTRRRTWSRTPSSLLCTIRWWWRPSAWLCHAFQVAACHLRSLVKSTSLRRGYSCIDLLEYWTREEPIRVSGGKASFSPVDQEGRGLPSGPTSCHRRSRSLRWEHPLGPPRVTGTRGLVLPQLPRRC
jgi:hypothetical protein